MVALQVFSCLFLLVTLPTDALSKGTCPQNNPNVYYNGEYCCKYAQEKVYKPQGALCDGGTIGFTSLCCKDNKNTKCTNPPCSSYTVKYEITMYTYSSPSWAATSDFVSLQILGHYGMTTKSVMNKNSKGNPVSIKAGGIVKKTFTLYDVGDVKCVKLTIGGSNGYIMREIKIKRGSAPAVHIFNPTIDGRYQSLDTPGIHDDNEDSSVSQIYCKAV